MHGALRLTVFVSVFPLALASLSAVGCGGKLAPSDDGAASGGAGVSRGAADNDGDGHSDRTTGSSKRGSDSDGTAKTSTGKGTTPSDPVGEPVNTCTPPAANPLGIQYPAWIRIAYTYSDKPFDVCFPLVAKLNEPADFTGAKPAIGGAGISKGVTTPYIAVPPYTWAMRFVAAGAADCSTPIGVRLSDDIGAFSANAGAYMTLHVDRSGYDYSRLDFDSSPVFCH